MYLMYLTHFYLTSIDCLLHEVHTCTVPSRKRDTIIIITITGTRHALAHMSWDRPLLEVEASPPLVWLGRCRRLGVGTGAAK